jgi:hypothetical protein
MRASTTVRSSCSVSARWVASVGLDLRPALAARYCLDDEGDDDEQEDRDGVAQDAGDDQ